MFLASFKLIHFLLPDSPPVALNDALAAMSYEHVLDECMRVTERYEIAEDQPYQGSLIC